MCAPPNQAVCVHIHTQFCQAMVPALSSPVFMSAVGVKLWELVGKIVGVFTLMQRMHQC